MWCLLILSQQRADIKTTKLVLGLCYLDSVLTVIQHESHGTLQVDSSIQHDPDPVSLPTINSIVSDNEESGTLRQHSLLAASDHVAVEHVHVALSHLGPRDHNFTLDVRKVSLKIIKRHKKTVLIVIKDPEGRSQLFPC